MSFIVASTGTCDCMLTTSLAGLGKMLMFTWVPFMLAMPRPVTFTAVDVFWQPLASVTFTVYDPLEVAVYDELVAPVMFVLLFIHWYAAKVVVDNTNPV